MENKSSVISEILQDLAKFPADQNTALRVASELYCISDQKDLLAAILDAVLATTGMEYGFVAIKKGGESFTLPVAPRRYDCLNGKWSNSVLKWVLQQKEILLSQGSFPEAMRLAARALGLTSVLCIPFPIVHRADSLVDVADTWGALYAHSTKPLQEWGEEQQAFFRVLAGHAAMAIERDHLQQIATVDGLTGLFRRNHLWSQIEVEWSRTLRYDRPLSVAMIDIDHFKHYNDRFGHAWGDQVLQQIAQTLKKEIRREDLLGRYGGDEFLLLLPETDRPGATIIAERLRYAVQSQSPGTISVGLCSYPEVRSGDIGQLVEKADMALLKAKSQGKNRVCALDLQVGVGL